MFKLVPESQFGEPQFEEHPIWARFYEPDEIEEIVSWGIEREALMRELHEKHDGSDHAYYPVLQTDPLPDSLDLYIRAEFVTPDGRQLTGCLSGIEAYVVTLFWANDQFTFSARGLSDLNAGELSRLRAAMGDTTAEFFPIAYRTNFRTTDGQSLAGTFSPQCN